MEFLRLHDAETLLLVGDIVDGLLLKRAWQWPQAHNDVVQKLLRKARKGAKVIYTPGNHDEFLRNYLGLHFGGVEVAESKIHETADGLRLLVIHGGQFDVVLRHARRWCKANKFTFTTSYHTQFPDCVAARFPVSREWIYRLLRKFHGSGSACLVPTQNVQDELEFKGFKSVVRWSRGVVAKQFRPNTRLKNNLSCPRLLYVGRIAVEKNIDAFLKLNVVDDKVIVGDGPAKVELERKFPEATFLGKLEGQELVDLYASCDVFVFPSRTDTFGIVLLEALACGLPVAAYPVTGPIDVVGPSIQQGSVLVVKLLFWMKT